jgi:hypothetical protein
LAWGVWEQDLFHIIKKKGIISISWLWEGEEEKDVKFFCTGEVDDIRLLKKIHSLLDECTWAVAQNGDNFDFGMINNALLVAGFKPPSPYKTIDTLKILRKITGRNRNSNKLNDVCEELGLGKKKDTGGKQLWIDFLFGTPKVKREAIKKLRIYNNWDVILLKRLFHYTRGWAITLPKTFNMDMRCPRPSCGSTHIVKQGWEILANGWRRQKYQCVDCGGWTHSSKKEKVFDGEFLK